MRVYIAKKSDYDQEIIYGVFSTLELAQAACGDSSAAWEEDDEGGWYRPEVYTEPLRVESAGLGLGWWRTQGRYADAGYVQCLDLDIPITVPGVWVMHDTRPMTEQDEAEWAAYMEREVAAGRVASTTVNAIHITSQ